MATLVFDIETVGEEFDTLDETTKEGLTRWIKKEAGSANEYEVALSDLKDGLGFSPLTGQIVAIGVLDCEKNKAVVYFQAPGKELGSFEEDGVTFRQMTEKEMLEHFWAGAKQYQEFVSFNGRGFDAPFLAIRSAVHSIRPTVDLMSNRYLSSQWRGPRHIDLMDQMSFYGATRRKGSLHLYCRAFGIKSPKSEGVTGDDVGPLFKAGKYAEIAKYNVGDLRAIKELYEYWKQYLNFG